MKESYRLEYQTSKGAWYEMYTSPAKGLTRPIITKTLEECQKERSKAIKRHKPYGRDYTYRIVRVIEEVVE
jgi:hypothetical protein